MSNRRLSQLVLHVNKSIDSCGLRVNIRNHFTRIMNKAVKSGNRMQMVFTSGLVKQELNQLKPLTHHDSIVYWNKYIMAVIFDHIMPFNTLADSYWSKDKGNQLFNFYDDSTNYYLAYSHRVIRIMKQTNLPLDIINKTMHHEDPELFYDIDHMTLTYASRDVKGSYKWAKHHKMPTLWANIPKENQVESLRSGLVLSDTNNIINDYLVKIHILEKHGLYYHLTPYGKKMIDPKRFLKFVHTHVAFNSNIIGRTDNTLIEALSWLEMHRHYHRFFGIGLLIKLINYKNFKLVNRYNDPYSHSTTLGMKPYTYMCIMLGVLNKYFNGSPDAFNQCMVRLEYTEFLIKSLFAFEINGKYKLRQPYK